MKTNKSKVVFISILVCILLFIVGYSIMIFGEDDSETINLSTVPLPALEKERELYHSKVEAIDDIKKQRTYQPPLLYEEDLTDSTGSLLSDLEELQKEILVDSVLTFGAIDYAEKPIRPQTKNIVSETNDYEKDLNEVYDGITDRHHDFFNQIPEIEIPEVAPKFHTNDFIKVKVHGSHKLKDHYRVTMRLTEAITMENELKPQGTLIYGIANFSQNRMFVKVTNIDLKSVSLEAYDCYDGNKGVYVITNIIRANEGISGELLDEAVNQVNVPGVPDFRGIRDIFQRKAKMRYVKIPDGLEFILRPIL